MIQNAFPNSLRGPIKLLRPIDIFTRRFSGNPFIFMVVWMARTGAVSGGRLGFAQAIGLLNNKRAAEID